MSCCNLLFYIHHLIITPEHSEHKFSIEINRYDQPNFIDKNKAHLTKNHLAVLPREVSACVNSPSILLDAPRPIPL